MLIRPFLFLSALTFIASCSPKERRPVVILECPPVDPGVNEASMPIAGAAAASLFWIQLHVPGSDEPLLAGPFDLDRYVAELRQAPLMSAEPAL